MKCKNCKGPATIEGNYAYCEICGWFIIDGEIWKPVEAPEASPAAEAVTITTDEPKSEVIIEHEVLAQEPEPAPETGRVSGVIEFKDEQDVKNFAKSLKQVHQNIKRNEARKTAIGALFLGLIFLAISLKWKVIEKCLISKTQPKPEQFPKLVQE